MQPNQPSGRSASAKILPYLIFLIVPWAALVVALREIGEKRSANLIWLFISFFGYTFVITQTSTADSVRYAETLSTFYSSSYSLADIFGAAYVSEGFLDLYQPILTYFVSRFTGEYQPLFLIYAIVFGYFYSRNVWMITKLAPTISLPSAILLSLFLFQVFLHEGINGVRFWTAAHIYVYGFLRAELERKPAYMYFCYFTVLLHFAFSVVVLLTLIYSRIPKSARLLYPTFLVSFILGSPDFNLGSHVSAALPEFLHWKIDAYIGTEGASRYVETEQVELAWFLVLLGGLSNVSIVLLLSVLFFKRSIFSRDRALYNLFYAAMFFYTIFNLFSGFPSAARFLVLPAMLVFAQAFLLVARGDAPAIRRVALLLIPFAVLLMVVKMRDFTDYANTMVLFAGPVFLPFYQYEQSLWQFIN